MNKKQIIQSLFFPIYLLTVDTDIFFLFLFTSGFVL